MKNLEHDLQVACIRWFKHQYPQLLIYAIPNGGARSAATGAMLKAEGVRAGVPDLFLATARGSFHGLYIELKVGKNKSSEAQIDIQERLRCEGYKVVVCYTLESFINEINTYLNNKSNEIPIL